MSVSASGDQNLQQSSPPPDGPLVTRTDGTFSVNQASMGATVKSVLSTANEIGSFWFRWGVSASLFIIGTFAIVVAFLTHAFDARLWDDNSFFGALAFALATLILGFIAFADKQNRSSQTGQQAVTIYQIAVNASLEGQRIGAEERIAAQPKIQTNGSEPGGFKG